MAHPEFNIVIGKKFGRLTLLNTSIVGKYRYGNFICDCGINTNKIYSHVKNGFTTSCGCFQKEGAALRTKTHGMTETSEFNSWQAMISRCYNKNNHKYKDYGGRGISVCDRWLNSFENFFNDMGLKPTLKHSIDRFPNNDGNYEPSNCRWGTFKEQAGNTRRNNWIEYNGENKILQDWANELGATQANVWRMLKIKTFEQVYQYYTNKLKKKDTKSFIGLHRNRKITT